MNENSDAIIIIILVLMAKSNSKQGEKYNFKSMQKKRFKCKKTRTWLEKDQLNGVALKCCKLSDISLES